MATRQTRSFVLGLDGTAYVSVYDLPGIKMSVTWLLRSADGHCRIHASSTVCVLIARDMIVRGSRVPRP